MTKCMIAILPPRNVPALAERALKARRGAASVALILSLLATTSCASQHKDQGSALATIVAVGAVTSPIWVPALLVRNGFESATDRGARPFLDSDPAGDVLQQRDIEIAPGADAASSHQAKAFAAGPGRFVLIGRRSLPWDDGKQDVRWSGQWLSADSATMAKPWPFPGHASFLGPGPKGLILADYPYLSLQNLNPLDRALAALPTPVPDCESGPTQLSLSGRFVQCYAGGGDSIYDVATGRLRLRLATKSPTSFPSISVDVAENIIRESQSDAVIEALSKDQADRRRTPPKETPVAFDETGKPLITVGVGSGAAADGTGHILVKEVATGKILRDVVLANLPMVFGGDDLRYSAGRLLIIRGRDMAVVSLSSPLTAPAIHIKAGDRHFITTAAFDSTGEWLLVVGDGVSGRIFHLKPLAGS
jgi:hypothetical protein